MTKAILFQVLFDLGYSVWTAKLVYYEMLERVQGGEDYVIVLVDENFPIEYENMLIEAASEL